MPKEQPLTNQSPNATLTVDEASMRHEGEWVLMRVTGRDEQDKLWMGEVLHHSKSRKEISQHVKQMHKQDPSVHLLVTLGGTRRVTIEEFRQGLITEAKDKYINARW